jgi:hypothetical protein
VRASLPVEIKTQIAAHLTDMNRTGAALDDIPFERFAPISYDDYLSSPAVVEGARLLSDDTR